MKLHLSSGVEFTKSMLRLRDLESKEAFHHERKLTAKKIKRQKDRKVPVKTKITTSKESRCLKVESRYEAKRSETVPSRRSSLAEKQSIGTQKNR